MTMIAVLTGIILGIVVDLNLIGMYLKKELEIEQVNLQRKEAYDALMRKMYPASKLIIDIKDYRIE